MATLNSIPKSIVEPIVFGLIGDVSDENNLLFEDGVALLFEDGTTLLYED